MTDHDNESSELKLSDQNINNQKVLTPEQEALQQLAMQLHRPPQSLAAFSHLSVDQLNWLTARVELICKREDARLRDELNQAIPKFLQPLFLRRLRNPS
ncbi:MAG: hypothetical protein KGO49_06750 [Gammaproteobacteria bacterium]|nr:hypothetical protein [Gammaproteobacteria bacterium]